MKRLFLSLLLFLPLFSAHATDVKVTIQNLTGDTVSVSLFIGKNVADPSASINQTKTMYPTDLTWTFEIKDVERYSVMFAQAIILKNNLPGGKITGTSKVISERRNDVYNWTVELNASNKRTLDELSEEILEYDPTKFIEDSHSPKPLNELFNQYLGALQAYRITNGDTIWDYRVPPFSLNLDADIGEIEGRATSSKTIEFYRKLDQKVDGSIPAIADLGINFGNNQMHSVRLEYKEIGEVGWRQTPSMSTKDPVAIYKEDMHSAHQIELGRLYYKYRDEVKLQRIDKAYIFDGIYIEHVQSSGFAGSNEINVSTFVTNQGSFDFSNSTATKKVFGSSYLGYWISESSPNFGGLLEYFGAVYANQIPQFYKDEQIVNEYRRLREVNNNLPDLSTPDAIRSYYRNQVSDYLQGHPEDINKALLKNNVTLDDVSSIDFLNQDLINKFKRNFDIIPEGADDQSVRELLKKMESRDPNFRKVIEGLKKGNLNN
ncbi:MAG: hypothetical protein HWE07_04925 [Cytophagia bacterium]|nr:hypothetical protein [Cytophagia bacterium]